MHFEAIILNSEIMTRLCTTEDALEGINAFIEKRRPKWKGKWTDNRALN
jgi:1,4-dihydroxy-2-naphthoyl-CoA synthase